MIADGTAPPRYIMIGGFLGAGKTTAAVQLARRLTDRGMRVGLISNDQSTGLVDTALFRSHGFAVEEIAGGCFCCRFDSLLEATRALTAETRPDVFIAEPVGSCTDLIATVSYPLRRIYGDRVRTAPLSVLVDPGRAARILGISQGRSFSAKVAYIYKKQLEEANIIIINKCDDLDATLRETLGRRLRESFPRAEVFCCSARAGTGLDAWFDRLLEMNAGDEPAMDLDYDRYAEGEALLGWLNCTIELSADTPFDGNAWLLKLGERLCEALRGEVREIAHAKMTLDARDDVGSLCVVSSVGVDRPPELRESLLDPVDGGTLIINLRAEGNPDVLRRVTTSVVDAMARSQDGLSAKIEHIENFRPARPTPTHRISTPA